MEIISGKIASAQKILLYGVEGIGKSTFAASFPNSLVIDTEGSTKELDVRRFEKPGSWAMLKQQVEYVAKYPGVCDTLIIDTIDWAEAMAIKHVLSTVPIKDGKYGTGIEDFGYGKGYTYLEEETGRLLNLLDMVIEQGVNVVLVAHAIIKKFELPEEMGTYDRWEPNLEKKVNALIKQWSDMILFCNYKIVVENVDGQGATKGKNKAQGGRRVVYTSHHPSWDAKNRKGFPPEMPLDPQFVIETLPRPTPELPTPIKLSDEEIKRMAEESKPSADQTAEVVEDLEALGIPAALAQLMQADGIRESEVRQAVFERTYYPIDTPIKAYDPSFVQGVLIGAWPQVRQMIMDERAKMPF